MSNLFGTVDFNKTATHAVMVLSTDSTKWSKMIIHDFMENYPYLQNVPLLVTWKEKDFAKGYAVGSLDVGGVKVPLIVKEFILTLSAVIWMTLPLKFPPSIIVVFLFSPVRFIVLFTITFSKYVPLYT